MEEEPKLYSCTNEGCNSIFDTTYMLQQHQLTHDKKKLFNCTEENCTKTYTSKSHLDRHINCIHKKNKSDVIHSCPECLKTFANRQNLKRHIKRYHINISFLCDICKKKFNKKNQLTAHMFQHNGIKAFKCDICPKDFITLYAKKKHMRNHKTYNCDQCSLKFDLWSQYVKHKRLNHATKEFICNDCGKNFKKKSHILRHVKIHSQVLLRTFLCPFESCERRYSRNSNLRQHILMKHEGITHECNICNAQLCSKSTLQNHIKKLHSGKEIKPRAPKTIDTGRNFRRDKNTFKCITALKLAGMKSKPEIENTGNTMIAANEIVLAT